MSAVFAQVMGDDFERLHPMLQRRFGVGLESGYACVGRGVMTSIRRGPWWTLPFLQIGRLRNILLPDVGEQVPFTIANYPYRDVFGRETVTFCREYRIGGRVRRFDATMIASQGRLIDYLGTHQHLAVDLVARARDDGSLRITTHGQRFYEGAVGFRFPLLLSGEATLDERYDEGTDTFHVRLEVRNRLLGFLFGYEGDFGCDYVEASDAPAELKPRRHERRT